MWLHYVLENISIQLYVNCTLDNILEMFESLYNIFRFSLNKVLSSREFIILWTGYFE